MCARNKFFGPYVRTGFTLMEVVFFLLSGYLAVWEFDFTIHFCDLCPASILQLFELYFAIRKRGKCFTNESRDNGRFQAREILQKVLIFNYTRSLQCVTYI